MKFKENQLKNFASPISATEDQKCKNALNMVRDALKNIGYTDDNNVSLLYPDTSSYAIDMNFSSVGQTRKVRLFVQGSYANKTNIPTESDVDIAVVLLSTFWSEYPIGISAKSYGFIDSSDTLQYFKDDVEELLKQKFPTGVVRHNKSIEVKGNTYRVDADTVPCGQHRDYRRDNGTDPTNFIEGIIIQPDSGTRIINYPQQHIQNGIIKNKNTGFAFKRMVRIAKNIRECMVGIKSAEDISSFLIESLLWNVPDDVYTKYTLLRYTFGEIVEYLKDSISQISYFKEINGIKYLTTYDHSRLNICRQFIDDLSKFYEYDITEL